MFDDKLKIARKPGKKQGKSGRMYRVKVKGEKEIYTTDFNFVSTVEDIASGL